MGEVKIKKYKEDGAIDKNEQLKKEIGKRITKIRNGRPKKDFAAIIRNKAIVSYFG